MCVSVRESPPFVEAEVGQKVVDGEKWKIRSLDGQKPCREETDSMQSWTMCTTFGNKSLLALGNKHVYRMQCRYNWIQQLLPLQDMSRPQDPKPLNH